MKNCLKAFLLFMVVAKVFATNCDEDYATGFVKKLIKEACDQVSREPDLVIRYNGCYNEKSTMITVRGPGPEPDGYDFFVHDDGDLNYSLSDSTLPEELQAEYCPPKVSKSLIK